MADHIPYITPESFGAIGDASVSYTQSGVVIGYSGTDDTNALISAFAAAQSQGLELRLSKWYRVTSPLTTITKPFAIVGIGRFNCGIVFDKTASGAALTISECWMGRDIDEITPDFPVRDMDRLYSGPKLEGFSIVGDCSTDNIQHGIVLHRRVDKLRIWDVGTYHIKGCGLFMGYDDRPVETAKASIRECFIHFEARWCGNASNEFAAIRYWSFGYQAGDDASNNNVFDLETFFSDGIGLHISGRNTNGAMIRYDSWTRVMSEMAGSDTVVVEGNIGHSRFAMIEVNPTTAQTNGIVLREWSGNPSVTADRMPRNLTFGGVIGGRAGTNGILVEHGKNITFDNFAPSAFRAIGGNDYHLIVKDSVSGVVQVTGAASQGYAWNIDCAAAALPYLRVDPGRQESFASTVPSRSAMAHSWTYVPDAFYGSTPGMVWSNGSALLAAPVSTKPWRSDDTPATAGSGEFRIASLELEGRNNYAATFRIGNRDDTRYIQWYTSTIAGIMPGLMFANGSVSGPCMEILQSGQVQFPRALKLITPASQPNEPGSLYRSTLGTGSAANFLTFQPGAAASRFGIFAGVLPDANASGAGWVVIRGDSTSAIGKNAAWVSLPNGSWQPFGIIGQTQGAAVSDSTATDVAGVNAKLNALLASLRAAKVIA